MADYGLIVFDASPLITLAKAGELDVLLRQPLPIIIPDAVYREAANPSYDDGVRIMEWIETNQSRVRTANTRAGLQQDILLKNGVRATDLGEAAAIEVTDRFLADNPDNRVALIYEDAGVRKRERDPRVDIFSTASFLHAMEGGGYIQSADQILEQASQAGRNVAQQKATIAVLKTGSVPKTGILAQFRSARTGSTGLLDTTPNSLNKSPDDPSPTQGQTRGRSR
jgi:predicted nucleic acid-binding protein